MNDQPKPVDEELQYSIELSGKQPKPTTEWTVKLFRSWLSHAANRGMIDEYVQDICDKHNAAVAAEREERAIIERSRDAWQHQVAGLAEQLTAEREARISEQERSNIFERALAAEKEGK